MELVSRSFFWGGLYNQAIFKDPIGRHYHDVIVVLRTASGDDWTLLRFLVLLCLLPTQARLSSHVHGSSGQKAIRFFFNCGGKTSLAGNNSSSICCAAFSVAECVSPNNGVADRMLDYEQVVRSLVRFSPSFPREEKKKRDFLTFKNL